MAICVKDMSDRALKSEVECYFQEKDYIPSQVKKMMFVEGCIAELERRGYVVETENGVNFGSPEIWDGE